MVYGRVGEVHNNIAMEKSTDVQSNICTFFAPLPIYFYHYICYNVRKDELSGKYIRNVFKDILE